ncbi:hypothetical protein DFP94_106132 [Fontibacillus phaseoli]|uniref:Uncharacterized protein n=1 Tax=Fontibacillus phaseoli TaxID=1416533 RepID=A0A369BDB4_9BACL|nr:hypothetical protein [Fontibacillus phaseoli]RCX18598.1 hypothetical protein DFP94_106132 [Fontibacillus phaseoli]
MDMLKFIEDNIKLAFFVIITITIFNLFVRPIYTLIKFRFLNSKCRKLISKSIVLIFVRKVILPFGLISIFVAIQQKYSFIQFGAKENYNALVISILALYGILYTFLQFTISYALQSQQDKYWGQSITRMLFMERLGFGMFRSGVFKLLLIYAVVYPFLSRAILVIINRGHLNGSFAEAFWQVCIVVIYILYVHLFIRSLNGMKTMYSVQERRVTFLERKIEEEVIENYKQLLDLSYEDRTSQFFLKSLFRDLDKLPKEEQSKMLMGVLRGVFDSNTHNLGYEWVMVNKFPLLQKKRDIYTPHYLHKFFNDLYYEIDNRDIELNIRDLLMIYELHDKSVSATLNEFHSEQDDSFINKLVKVYSTHNDRIFDECTYFEVPAIIIKSLSSYEDIELLHQNMIHRKGFVVIEKVERSKEFQMNHYEKKLVSSYDRYLTNLLDYYKSYVDELKKRAYSRFWKSLRSNFNKVYMNECLSAFIYEYIIDLEYTDQNKKYVNFMVKQLDYKYRVSIIFYHLLYPSTSWKWQSDVPFLKEIATSNQQNEVFTSDLVDFVCHTIKNIGNIGHKIEDDLIRWIFHHRKIKNLNEIIVNECLSKNMTYVKLIEFNYIFSDYRYYLTGFYDFDFSKIHSLTHQDWTIDFLRDVLRTPHLLNIEFFSSHLLLFCENICYLKRHLVFENDFRIFFINRFFKFSEREFNALLNNNYLCDGIIEFLVLHLSDKEYEYLINNGEHSRRYALRVKEIIYRKNVTINDYISQLVGQANECRKHAIPVMKEGEILDRLQSLLKAG